MDVLLFLFLFSISLLLNVIGNSFFSVAGDRSAEHRGLAAFMWLVSLVIQMTILAYALFF